MDSPSLFFTVNSLTSIKTQWYFGVSLCFDQALTCQYLQAVGFQKACRIVNSQMSIYRSKANGISTQKALKKTSPSIFLVKTCGTIGMSDYTTAIERVKVNFHLFPSPVTISNKR